MLEIIDFTLASFGTMRRGHRGREGAGGPKGPRPPSNGLSGHRRCMLFLALACALALAFSAFFNAALSAAT